MEKCANCGVLLPDFELCLECSAALCDKCFATPHGLCNECLSLDESEGD